ncbi:MAG TPA: hypothetical protein VHT29_01895 [Solirubrobacteraceae bacterium]|nr:hypothetical protein [Solirubrobacteraceae bacterium]
MHEMTTRLRASLAAILVMGALLALPGIASAQFGISSFSTTTSSPQAGGHPDLTASFALNTDSVGNPIEQLKNATVVLPPGVLGDAQSFERCATRTFDQLKCRPASQIGVFEGSFIICRGVDIPLEATAEAGSKILTLSNTAGMCAAAPDNAITIGTGATAETARLAYVLSPTTVELQQPLEFTHAAGEPVTHIAETPRVPLPLMNLQPSPGHIATFGASLLLANIFIQVDMRPDGRLTATITEASTLLGLQSAALNLWGVPADPSHDALHCNMWGIECGTDGLPATSFTTYPTKCDGAPLENELTVESWRGASSRSTSTEAAPTGCNSLQMSPSLSVVPGSTQEDSPAGYNVDVNVPQQAEPYGLATPALEHVSVALPPGTSLSPGLANGLQACSEDQFAEGSCPDASKVGTAEIATPVLAQPLTGGIYIGAPTASEKYRLFARVSGDGVTLNLAGRVEANEQTGQLTAVFDHAPQLPFSDFRLNLFGGPGAALANPQSCGVATSTAELTSYGGQSASPSSSFTVDANDQGGACPASKPFAPNFTAGSSSPAAGAFSPFTLTIARADGERNLETFDAQLPAGLVGLLKSAAPCLEPQAAQGSCPASARVGTATIGAGAGSQPLYISGPVYLTGPYGGAPFGLVTVINVVAGPFNLGTVVVRSRITVNPRTLDLSIASDPLPQIVGGIPLRLRALSVSLDRPRFILNPSNCAAQSVTATLSSIQGPSVDASAPFDVVGCSSLPFAPKLSASTPGRASSQGNGAGLDIAIATAGATAAAMKSATITLPSAMHPRLSTIQHACPPGVTDLQSGCPAESVVGSAVVSTPVLPAPLTGAVYLVAHGGTRLPSLVMVLHGDGINVELDGSLSIAHSGAVSASFLTLPDAPIESLKLNLPRGRHSILGAAGDLCGKSLGLPYSLTSQGATKAKATARVAISGCTSAEGKSSAHKAGHSSKKRARR